jgi:hypothetical protein
MTSDQQQTCDLTRYIAMLAAREPAGGLLELRYRDARAPARMRQQFHDLAAGARIARQILTLAAHSDVYIGVAPRRIPSGGRHAIHRGWVLWADIDDSDSDQRLAMLAVAPGAIVNSGSPGHQHLYWPLREPLAPAELELANARLAAALCADRGAVLGAQTILRPPHTRNHKHTPPTPVTLERLELQAHSATEILAGLAPLTPAVPRAGGRERDASSDPLQAIEPAHYVEALTGQLVPRQRKINCPLHDDRTPSLHVFEQPNSGWYCFGCSAGGDVYELAGKIWGLQTRGSDFLELRRRLNELLLGAQGHGSKGGAPAPSRLGHALKPSAPAGCANGRACPTRDPKEAT